MGPFAADDLKQEILRLQEQIDRLKHEDKLEQLRLWIWEQIDRHGDDLIAVQPTFDLILNKIDEIQSHVAKSTSFQNRATKSISGSNAARSALYTFERLVVPVGRPQFLSLSGNVESCSDGSCTKYRNMNGGCDVCGEPCL